MVKCVLDPVDRKFIHDELLNHPAATAFGFKQIVNQQMTNFCILHNKISEINEAGTSYLHNWLNTLVSNEML